MKVHAARLLVNSLMGGLPVAAAIEADLTAWIAAPATGYYLAAIFINIVGLIRAEDWS